MMAVHICMFNLILFPTCELKLSCIYTFLQYVNYLCKAVESTQVLTFKATGICSRLDHVVFHSYKSFNRLIFNIVNLSRVLHQKAQFAIDWVSLSVFHIADRPFFGRFSFSFLHSLKLLFILCVFTVFETTCYQYECS